MIANDAVATAQTVTELTMANGAITIVRLMDTASTILKLLKVGADDGRKTTHLTEWKNLWRNDYGHIQSYRTSL